MHENGYCPFQLVSRGPPLFLRHSPVFSQWFCINGVSLTSEITVMTFPQKVQPFLKHIPLVHLPAFYSIVLLQIFMTLVDLNMLSESKTLSNLNHCGVR